MHRNLLFPNTMKAPSRPSGWVSWAPEVADAPTAREPDEQAEPMFRVAGALSFLMWACACLMAASSL